MSLQANALAACIGQRPEIKPDDANLFDLLQTWAPDEATRNTILVTNPEALYGFPGSA